MKKEHIVLIHGLYMSNVVMQYLRVSLQDLGYPVSCFQYKSIQFEEFVFDDLAAHIESNLVSGRDLVLVGHSMGGLIAREFAMRHEGLVSCIVTLGTPHRGSIVGKVLEPLGILGTAGDSGITKQVRDWNGCIPLGSIAGNLPVGVLFASKLESDGTVLLSETHCENSTDHIVLRVSHTGMVYSKKVVACIDGFIENKRFSQ